MGHQSFPPVQTSTEVLCYGWQLRLGKENTVLAAKCRVLRKGKSLSLLSQGFDFCFRTIKLSTKREGGAGTHWKNQRGENKEGVWRESDKGGGWYKRRGTQCGDGWSALKVWELWGEEEMAENWEEVDGRSDGQRVLRDGKLRDYYGRYGRMKSGRAYRDLQVDVHRGRWKRNRKRERWVLMDEGGRVR